jgi:hypothetical protein
MQDDNNTKLFEIFQEILKELTFHAKENNCQHRVQHLLNALEFEND